MRAALLVSILSMASCGIPVSVRNAPDRPVPTAPMAVEYQDAEGVTHVNPQLGAAPVKSAYVPQGPGLMGGLIAALTGDWATVIAAVAGAFGIGTGGYALQKRNEAKLHRKDADEAWDHIKKKAEKADGVTNE